MSNILRRTLRKLRRLCIDRKKAVKSWFINSAVKNDNTYLISFSPRNGTKSLTTCSSISSTAKKENYFLSYALSAPRTFAISRIDYVFLGLYQRIRRLKPSKTPSEVTSLSCGRDARLISKKRKASKRAMMMIFIPALISRIFSLTTSL